MRGKPGREWWRRKNRPVLVETWASDVFFLRRGELGDFSNNFLRTSKSGEICFFPLETEQTTSFAEIFKIHSVPTPMGRAASHRDRGKRGGRVCCTRNDFVWKKCPRLTSRVIPVQRGDDKLLRSAKESNVQAKPRFVNTSSRAEGYPRLQDSPSASLHIQNDQKTEKVEKVFGA